MFSLHLPDKMKDQTGDSKVLNETKIMNSVAPKGTSPGRVP
jgi:hypothetical protein